MAIGIQEVKLKVKVDLNINLSFWTAFKLRFAGKELKNEIIKTLKEKLEKIK